MSEAKEKEEDGIVESSTDELQNGGYLTTDERVLHLERKVEFLVKALEGVVKKNCLLTPDDGR